MFGINEIIRIPIIFMAGIFIPEPRKSFDEQEDNCNDDEKIKIGFPFQTGEIFTGKLLR